MTELRGNSGTYLTLKIDAGTAVEYSDDLKVCRITNEDKDDVTFGEVKRGEVSDAVLTFTAIIATATGRLWRFIWENAGKEVDVVYGAHGNETATDDKPHMIGTVKLPRKPELGSEASVESGRAEFEYEAPFTTGPLIDEGV